MSRKNRHLTFIIALVVALVMIPGTVFAATEGSANESPKLAAPKLTNYAAGPSSITNRWSAVKNAKGYEVYRSGKASGKFKKVKTLKGAKKVTWTDKKRSKNKYCFYKVRAYGMINGKKEYSDFSQVQSAAPTNEPNWEYSISGKTKTRKNVTVTLTNKSRYRMTVYADGLYLINTSAWKNWEEMDTDQWKKMTDKDLKGKGMIHVTGKKVNIKPGKKAILTYKNNTSIKYTKAGRIISEFRYNGKRYGVYHSYKYGSGIWVYE